MGAPLTIEQMILNHNIGVNLSDATTLEGHTLEEFSMRGHKHSADDITSGILNPQRLPKSSTSTPGIVALTNSLESDSQTLAPTAYALASLFRVVLEKADLTHQHNPAQILSGTFPGVMAVASNKSYTTKQLRNIIFSTNPPSPTDGEDGDVWLQYEE